MSSQAAGTGGTVPILDARHEYKCRLGEAWDILLHLAGRSLAAFGHAAGSVTESVPDGPPQPRNEVTRFRRRTARLIIRQPESVKKT